MSVGPALSRMHNKCINRDHHVPSSTLCMISTTNIGNILKPEDASLVEKMFCVWSEIQTLFRA
jgi:hypothetical protein